MCPPFRRTVGPEKLPGWVSPTCVVQVTTPGDTVKHACIPASPTWGKASLEGVAEEWVGIWGPNLKDLPVSDCGSQLPAPFTSRTLSSGWAHLLLPAPALGQEQNRGYCLSHTCQSPRGRHPVCSQGGRIAGEFWK